ncbi:hypothetical protein HY945_05205 [Candidatus Gottesmanbacteria bacterium]|nr:hypothetical protein [Candidatus Gottesmanbacteria bacterium]
MDLRQIGEAIFWLIVGFGVIALFAGGYAALQKAGNAIENILHEIFAPWT